MPLSHPASPLAFGPEPSPAEGDELPLPDNAREALLRRLEAWIEEEERLVAEIERRLAATRADVVAFRPSAAAAEPKA